jgi:hypothetical protein
MSEVSNRTELLTSGSGTKRSMSSGGTGATAIEGTADIRPRVPCRCHHPKVMRDKTSMRRAKL